jgi:molybdopterin synthase sulfur carrier subunit
MKKLNVLYFALLKQERGLADEVINTSASTVGELFDELKALHSFKLTQSEVRAAVNSKVDDGDQVLLIPPVAGG